MKERDSIGPNPLAQLAQIEPDLNDHCGPPSLSLFGETTNTCWRGKFDQWYLFIRIESIETGSEQVHGHADGHLSLYAQFGRKKVNKCHIGLIYGFPLSLPNSMRWTIWLGHQIDLTHGGNNCFIFPPHKIYFTDVSLDCFTIPRCEYRWSNGQ